MNTRYMTDFQRDKLAIMHEIANIKSQISSLDKRLQYLYDETTRLQELLLDLEEKNYE